MGRYVRRSVVLVLALVLAMSAFAGVASASPLFGSTTGGKLSVAFSSISGDSYSIQVSLNAHVTAGQSSMGTLSFYDGEFNEYVFGGVTTLVPVSDSPWYGYYFSGCGWQFTPSQQKICYEGYAEVTSVGDNWFGIYFSNGANRYGYVPSGSVWFQ